MSDPVMGALLLQEEWIDRRLRHLAVSHRRELCALVDAILAIAVVIKASSATTVLYMRAAEIGTRTLRLPLTACATVRCSLSRHIACRRWKI
jgi:hypothetical protein